MKENLTNHNPRSNWYRFLMKVILSFNFTAEDVLPIIEQCECDSENQVAQVSTINHDNNNFTVTCQEFTPTSPNVPSFKIVKLQTSLLTKTSKVPIWPRENQSVNLNISKLCSSKVTAWTDRSTDLTEIITYPLTNVKNVTDWIGWWFLCFDMLRGLESTCKKQRRYL